MLVRVWVPGFRTSIVDTLPIQQIFLVADGLNRYRTLDYSWTNTMLGCIAIVIGLPVVVVLWRYGRALRVASPYCADEEQT